MTSLSASPKFGSDTLNNDLPIEIWEHIFLLFCAGLKASGWRYSGSRHDLIPLTHVCKMWRAAALGATMLWTDIDMSCPKLIPMLLQRSGNFPLRVIHIRSSLDESRRVLAGDEIQQAWQQVLALSSRIHFLQISELSDRHAEEIPLIIGLLKNQQLSWPQLNTVKLNTAEDVSDLPFLSDNPVPLGCLAFGQTSVSFDLPVFGQHLSYLSLWATNITLNGLHAALRRCTQLKVLMLDNLDGVKVSTVQNEKPSRIMLGSLQQLCVLNMMKRNSSVLLETLEIPTTASSHLYLDSRRYAPSKIDDLVPSHHHILTRIRRSPRQVLQIATCETIISTGATPVYSSFRTPSDVDVIWVAYQHGPSRFDSDEAYFRSLASSACRDLTVILNNGQWVSKDISPLQWRGFLARYPNLESLRTRDFGTKSGHFHMLTKPLQALMVEDKGEFVLPQLRVFTTEFEGPLEELECEWDKVAKVLRRLCERGRNSKSYGWWR